jgi:hypothetical protein
MVLFTTCKQDYYREQSQSTIYCVYISENAYFSKNLENLSHNVLSDRLMGLNHKNMNSHALIGFDCSQVHIVQGTNAIAYYTSILITVLKCFIVEPYNQTDLRMQGVYSQYSIFFVTYEWAQ